jgi:outer membrane protein insertion porin family
VSRRIRRGLIVLAAVVVGLILASLLAVHTPWARNRALTFARDFVERYNLVLEAGSLGYNAVTRRITLTDVRLAAKGHEARPFLVAGRIEVQLPWAVYRRRFAIDHLEITKGVVDIYRDENNVTNLPPGSNRPTPEQPRRIDIRGLTLDGLDVRYTDAARDFGVTVPRIEAELANTLAGAKGSFAVRDQLTFRLRDRTMAMAPFETVMTFDGSNVHIDEARLASSEIDAFISGPITRVLDSPSFDLTLKGSVNLDKAMKWIPPPPVPVSGMATIEGAIKGPARGFVTDLKVTSTSLDVGRERGLDLAGPIQVSFDALTGRDLRISPESGGQISASFEVPWGGENGASSATAEWRGLDAQAALRLANLDPQPIGAAFEGSGTFTFGEPRRFTITNRSTGRAGRGVVPVTGTITATLAGDDYSFEHDHAFPGFTFEGQMRGRINRSSAVLTTMSGPAHARVSDVAAAVASIETLGAPVAAIMHEIRGPLDAPMTLGGSYRYPEITTTVTSDALVLPMLGEVRASASVVADTRSAVISKIDLQRGGAAITGDVRADITNRAWSGTIHVEAPNAEELQAEIPAEWRIAGPLSVDAVLGGTFEAFRLDTVINGKALTWAGQPIDRVTAKAVVTADDIDVTSLQLFQGAGYLDGRVRYEWETRAYAASLKGDRLSWQGSLLSPNDTQALFSIKFDGAGTVGQPKGVASIDFALTGGEAGTLIGAGDATAELDGSQAHIVARLPAIGALINADVATASPYDYRLKANLDRFELQKLSPFIGAIEAEVIGFATGTVTASGRLADDRDRVAFVNITELDAGIGGIPVTLNAPLNASLKGDDVELQNLFLRVGAGRLSASGRWNTKLDGLFKAQFIGDFQDVVRLGKAFGVPATFDGSGPLTFDLTSNGTRLGTSGTLSLKNGTFSFVGGRTHAVQGLTVDAALDGEQLTITRVTGNVSTGGIAGSFSASGSARLPELTLAAVDGAIVIDAAKFTFSGIPVQQSQPSRLELSKGTLRIPAATWSVAENALVLGGSIGIAAEDPPLELSVKGLVDLRVLSAFMSTVAFDGTADVNTLVGGTIAKPLLDGRIVLADAEIAIAEPRLLLSELNGPIVLDGQLAVIEGMRGLANGGALGLDGTLEFDGLALSGGAVNIQAQGVALEMPRGLRSEIDALVTFRPDAEAPSLVGDIRIAQSAYTETITLAALARQAATPVASSMAAERPYLDRLQLNLVVTTTENLIVDNNYGRLAAAANVRVVGTVAEPGMEGRVTLEEGGQIYLAGRTFRITRGDISFTDRRRIRPEFNIAAESQISNSNVTMTLTGTLERPTIDLTSEDGSMTPGDIASAIVGTANAEAALTLLSADLLGVTGRAIGLDAFRVERGDYMDADFDYDPTLIGTDNTDPTTRLTIGKRLSEQVEFTVSQDLRESGKATFVISIFPRHNVELRALSRDSGTLSFGVRHQVTFGGGVSRRPSERRVRPVVSEIRFIDVDPAIEALARNEISLDPGDDFDFLVLQRDIDRIREHFHELGYFEARVRTRRIESDDARSVVLEYRVERGPRTMLEIAGMVAPESLVAELEEAWHRNVFDQFLIEDLTHRVRRHLVDSGELASIVVGRIDRPAADVKRLRIEVTPGAPVTGREIRFTGNQQIDAARLSGEIATAGLEMEAWLDRTIVERTLRQFYNEQGYLRAEVLGRPLDIDGTVGVLTFDIKEGPQAQITAVSWTGVTADRLPAIEKAAALELPEPYVATGVADARRRVEDEYRRQGFNEADIEVVPSVNPDDTVALTIEVSEGTQQVIQDVEIAGVEVTNSNVIREALRFELGKPVDLDERALARKRLYDTNVFRIVDIQPTPLGEAANGVQPVKAVVSVEEYPEWNFRYGFQVEGERTLEVDEFVSTRNLGVIGELKNSNLFGRALTLGLFGGYQRDRRDATVFLSTQRLFGWRARTSLYGYVSRDNIRDELGEEVVALNDIQGISADQRWRRNRWQLVYGYRFERNHTYDPRPPNPSLPQLDFKANLAKLSTAVVFDRRDDPINARRGTFSAVSLDQSGDWLGSDVNNRKLLVQQFLFVPIGQLVLASRAIIGRAYGTDDLLPSDSFRAGGGATVRGYGEDSLGPRGEFSGIPEGGEKMLVLNQEARFPVYRWAHAVVFIDAGNIFANDEPWQWNALKIGYGLGLRLDTPVGLLRGDVGWPNEPLDPSRSTSKKARFYFGFGHIF